MRGGTWVSDGWYFFLCEMILHHFLWSLEGGALCSSVLSTYSTGQSCCIWKQKACQPQTNTEQKGTRSTCLDSLPDGLCPAGGALYPQIQEMLFRTGAQRPLSSVSNLSYPVSAGGESSYLDSHQETCCPWILPS